MEGILGRKLGITQIFTEDGATVPVTVVEAGPCVVVARRTTDRDGYEAVQLGLVEARPPRRVTKPQQGHFKKAGVTPTRRVVEFAVTADETWNPGDQVKVTIFQEKDYVDVVGTSKGKGFAGVVKKYHFKGHHATHGTSDRVRAPGSSGSTTTPGRVYKGTRRAGHMGMDRVTAQGLKVVLVDTERNLLGVHGAVPGPKGGLVMIKDARKQ